MKKFTKSAISLFMSAFAVFGLAGCNFSEQTEGGDTDNLQQQIKDLQSDKAELSGKIEALESQNKTNSEKLQNIEKENAELKQTLKDLQTNALNSEYAFFKRFENFYLYSDFDYSMANPDYSYEAGTEEDEELFAKIMSGEYSYKDYFDWFAANPGYILRYNEESLNCVEEVLKQGIFTSELREKYYGFYVADSTFPHLGTAGMSLFHYSISFNEDWTVKSFKQSKLLNAGELKQIDCFYNPVYSAEEIFEGYYLSFSTLHIEADMGDGKTADCSVDVTYYLDTKTQSVWNGEKQEHEYVTYLSECRVNADFNNCYSGGIEMFDRILIYTCQEGIWDLEKVWKTFKSQALTLQKIFIPE